MPVNHIPDMEERKKALNPFCSFIVQAPAGSGKTTLLIQRFLLLLSTVSQPEEILSITFTRKAAGEMRTKIIKYLQMAAKTCITSDVVDSETLELASLALARNSSEGWNILENPGRLKIQTIDSFCSYIAGRMPILSRMGGKASVNEYPDELYREAANRTLSMVDMVGDDGECVRQILRHMDNYFPNFESHLTEMLGKRDHWMRHIERTQGEERLKDLFEGAVSRLVEDALEDLSDEFIGHLESELTEAARYAASNLTGEGRNGSITLLGGISRMPRTSSDALPLWKAIADLLVTASGKWRKAAGVNRNIGFPSKGNDAAEKKKAFQRLLESLRCEAGLLAKLLHIRKLPVPLYEGEELVVMHSMFRLLRLAVRHLEEVFSERGETDFQARSMAAIDALGTDDNPTDLMLALDNRFRHILVDEYQDTSWTQLRLLKALTRGWEQRDGRTLFIVGDPMQSIYHFRDAEVGLFLDARDNNIGSVKLNPLNLKSNFRSQENIVQWVNETLGGAFPDADDIVTGAVTYSRSISVQPPIDGLSVEINLYDRDDKQREATDIINRLKRIDEGESKAILVRSRPHVKTIIRELGRAGVDFRGDEINSMSDMPVIQDLFSLLRAFIHPFDRVAWLALLRSRWCGLSLSDIHKLCFCDSGSPVWKLINDGTRRGSMSEDGRERIRPLSENMKMALSLRGRIPVRSLLEGLWISVGGPACYGDDSMKFADTFFKMIESSASGGEIGSLRELEMKIGKLKATHEGKSKDTLLVTTIHNAKGLEFDHVFLPGLGKKLRSSDKNLLYWLERGDDLIMAPIESRGGSQNSIYNYLYDLYGKKDFNEMARVFYVAVTRARKGLHLFGHIRIGSDGLKACSGSFLSLIEDRLKPEMTKRGEATDSKNNDRGLSLKLKRLSRNWKGPEPAAPIMLGGVVRAASIRDARPVFDWAGNNIRVLGTVVHRYLYRMAMEGVESWSKDRLLEERPVLKRMLRSLGLDRECADRMSARGVSLLTKVLDDEKGRWILASHQDGSAELALTGVVDGASTHIVIDRTFVDEEGRRWIIDYKTGTHKGGSLMEFLQNERERYRGQLERYAAILGAGGEDREVKKGLYYPAVTGWIEW